MIGETLSHYRILEKIGAGGMGEVYLARDTRLERDVAIKLLPPGRIESEEARTLFRREALTLSKLNHPNIQTVHDFDSDGGVDFLVTEYVPGTTLSDLIPAGGLSLDVVTKLGEQLAAALQAAHECGVVHRDLKPSNIRVLPDGRLKVLDFGLAKLVGRESGVASSLSELETQTFAGTPHYMAPEQRLGHPADARTDLYAAGLVLKEMLGGKVPPSLARVVGRLLESEPAKRYQTAAELGKVLRDSAKRTFSLPWKLAAAGVAALAVVAALAFLRPMPSGIDSVVALPSEVHGPDAEEFLAEAFPNSLSTYLAQVDGLETKLSPTQLDIERFGGDLDRIARTYRVEGLVLSTVTATPEGFLLNVKLVDSSTRRIVWSSEYPGERSEYFSIARRAAEGLARQLGSSMRTAPAVHQVDAELAYQNGLYFANRYNTLHHMEDFDRALSSFEKTLELDPTFADAAALIGALYEFRLEAGLSPAEAIPQMYSWANKAIAIDPENGRAWTNLTLLEVGRGNEDASVTRSALRAVRYAPRFTGAHNTLGFALSSCFLSLQAQREAARLDPLYFYPPVMSAGSLACLGRIEEALAEVERVLAIEPNLSIALFQKAGLLHAMGRFDEAGSVLGPLEEMAADARVHPAWLGVLRDERAVMLSRPGEAAAEFRRLLDLASGRLPVPYWQLLAAMTVDKLGRQDRVEEARELLLALDGAGGVLEYDGLKLSPGKAWVRDDPTLAPILEKSKEKFEARLSILVEARARGELPAYLEQPLDELLVDLDWRNR